MSTKMYVGINNIARPVSKIYVGINNTAQLCYEEQAPTPTVPSWSTGTISEISNALQQAYAGQLDLTQYWHIGDERVVHCAENTSLGIREQDVVFVLMHKGGKMLSDGVTECQYVIGMKDVFNSTGTTSTSYATNMFSTLTTSGGWNSSTMRTRCNTIASTVIDQNFIQLCKQHINRTSAGNGSSTIIQSTDLLTLPSQVEVEGVYNKSYANEGTQLDYYKDSSHRIKHGIQQSTSTVVAATFWSRSCYNVKITYSKKTGYYACCYYTSSGIVNGERANGNKGVSVQTVI
jgi:hypothetical protein